MSEPKKPTDRPKNEREPKQPRRPLPSGPNIRDMTKERAGQGFGIMVPNAMPRPKDSKKG
jgi:hypothetical protein